MTDIHDPVEVSGERPLHISPNAVRALEKATGEKFGDLLGDQDDQAVRLQVTAFAELYRRYKPTGHMPDAASLWEEAGDVELDFVPPSTSDPLDAGSSTISPSSAGTGA